MRRWGATTKPLFFMSVFAIASQMAVSPADASNVRNHRQPVGAVHHGQAGRPVVRVATRGHGNYLHARRYAYGGISCVPFAREASGISVPGNAWQWWDNAAGVYARGSVPEAGSVLAFRSNGRMRLGHVAVVSRVINPREIEVEQANWSGGGVSRDTPVVDVSEANDWTAVRVGLGQSGQFGSVYPTYGFIYDRKDTGVLLATRDAPAPQPELNPAPSDLRPAAERGWETYEEVAEAPAVPRHRRRITHHLAYSHAHAHMHQVAALERRQ